MSLAKKLKDLDLILPDNLSEDEKKILQERFEQIKEVLEDTCKIILKMPREEAKRYYQLIIQKLQEADAYFVGGETPVAEEKEKQERKPRQDTSGERERYSSRGMMEFRKHGTPDFHPDDSSRPRVTLPKKVNFREYLNRLTSEEREKAITYLDCVKQFENGLEEVICTDCTLEILKTCIRGNDPTIKDPMADLIEEESRNPR